VLTAAVDEAKKHDISKRTVKRARAKLQGKTPAPKKKIGVSATPPKSEARPLNPSRASVVKPSHNPLRSPDLGAASGRVFTLIETEWKACPSQHREIFLRMLFLELPRFAEAHNANVVVVEKKVVGRGRSTR
jgi:hypothetical protein